MGHTRRWREGCCTSLAWNPLGPPSNVGTSDIFAHGRLFDVESVYPTIEEATEDRLRRYLGPVGPALAPLLLAQIPLRTGIALAELRPIDHMAELGFPVLVASGSEDRNTPPAETRRIYDAALGPKELWVVAGAGHVDLHEFVPDEYEAKVGAFLKRYMH